MFGAKAQGSVFGQQSSPRVGTHGVSYATTKDPDAKDGSRFINITAQSTFSKKSVEELRFEDYESGAINSSPASQPSAGLFGAQQSTPTPTQTPFGSNPFGSPAFGQTSTFGASPNPFASSQTPGFGSPSIFGSKPATGTTQSPLAFGSSPLFGQSSTPAFGLSTPTQSTIPAFGGTAPPTFGAFQGSSTPAFGSTPTFGSTPAFGSALSGGFGFKPQAGTAQIGFGSPGGPTPLFGGVKPLMGGSAFPGSWSTQSQLTQFQAPLPAVTQPANQFVASQAIAMLENQTKTPPVQLGIWSLPVGPEHPELRVSQHLNLPVGAVKLQFENVPHPEPDPQRYQTPTPKTPSDASPSPSKLSAVTPDDIINLLFNSEAPPVHLAARRSTAAIPRDLLAILPKFSDPNGEYYCEPAIGELAAREEATPGYLDRVVDFKVGRKGHGSITWPGPTDVKFLTLDKVVEVDGSTVAVHDEGGGSGSVLNKTAVVTIENVFVVDKATRSEVDDSVSNRLHIVERMKRLVERQGGRFLSYDREVGELRFFVDSF